MKIIKHPTFQAFLILGLFATLGSAKSAFAQENSRYSREERVPKQSFWGANLELQIGSYSNIGIAPFLGYSVAKGTDIGAGPFFQYALYRRNGYASYGGRAFVRQQVISNFFAQAAYEYMNTEDPGSGDFSPDVAPRINVNSLFLGAGYYGGIGNRTRMHLAIEYNVLDNDYRPYQSPMVRVGFSRYF